MKHSTQEVKLKNGVKGLLIDVPGSNVVYSMIGFRAGNLFAPVKMSEISHVLEHTIFSANSKFNSMLEYTAEFEKNGAWNNAFTSDHLVRYEFECADFETKRILGLQTIAISTPQFKPAEVKAELSNVEEELRGYVSNHGRMAYSLLRKAMAERPTYEDDLSTLKNITPASLRKFHTDMHALGNMHFIFSGNVKKQQQLLLNGVDRGLSKLPTGDIKHFPALPLKHLNKPVVLRRNIPQIYYIFEQWLTELAVTERAAAEVLGVLIAGRWKSWIFGEARKRGLAYGVSAGTWRYPHTSSFSVSGMVAPINAVALFELITRSLKKLIIGKIDNLEIKEAQKLIIGRRLRGYKTPSDMASWYAYEYFHFGELDDFQASLAEVKKVSVAEVKTLAKKIFDEQLWGVSFVGNIDNKLAGKLYGILSDIWN